MLKFYVFRHFCDSSLHEQTEIQLYVFSDFENAITIFFFATGQQIYKLFKGYFLFQWCYFEFQQPMTGIKGGSGLSISKTRF